MLFRYILFVGILNFAGTACADDLHPSLRDLTPKVFDRELRRALKAPAAETKTCSIPLLEVRGDRRIDPRMDLNRNGKPLRNEAIHTPNPAPACKGWTPKPF